MYNYKKKESKKEERVEVKEEKAVGKKDIGKVYGCGCKVVDVGVELRICPEHRVG